MMRRRVKGSRGIENAQTRDNRACRKRRNGEARKRRRAHACQARARVDDLPGEFAVLGRRERCLAPRDIERLARGRAAIGASRACIGCSMSNSGTICRATGAATAPRTWLSSAARSRPRAPTRPREASRHDANPPVGAQRFCYISSSSKSVNLDSVPCVQNADSPQGCFSRRKPSKL
jgi:hypothetical protein